MRRTPLPRRTPLRSTAGLSRRRRIPRVSAKRQRDNRARRKAMLAAFGPDPDCRFPGCPSKADDAHEVLTRGRGGSITDPANVAPLCRPHHDFVTTHPLEGHRLGLLKHSWEGDVA